MTWTDEDLSEFQRACRENLRASLATMGARLQTEEISEIRGEGEPYVVGSLANTGLRVFIYEDGAEISSDDDRVDLRFERPDYSSLKQLEQAFVTQALEMVKKR